MNPKLIKFSVELQNDMFNRETKKYIPFGNSCFGILFSSLFRFAKVAIPIDKNI